MALSVAARSAILSGVSRASVARPSRAQQARAGRALARPAGKLVVRASGEEPSSTSSAPSGGSFFYKGKSYTEAEWKEAVANGTVNKPADTPDLSLSDSPAPGEVLTLSQLMAFSGPAPELINGRLAMLAFVAALGAELSTGETVLRQLSEEPTGIVLAALAFIAASLIPLLSSTKREPFGPFTPAAEMLNGRAAMIGFASLLVAEAVRGSALF